MTITRTANIKATQLLAFLKIKACDIPIIVLFLKILFCTFMEKSTDAFWTVSPFFLHTTPIIMSEFSFQTSDVREHYAVIWLSNEMQICNFRKWYISCHKKCEEEFHIKLLLNSFSAMDRNLRPLHCFEAYCKNTLYM